MSTDISAVAPESSIAVSKTSMLDVMHKNREAVFADVVWATDASRLIDIPWDQPYEQMLARIEDANGERGVWCGGAAIMLHRKNLESGLNNSFLYFFGISGGILTHMYNVVHVDGRWWVQDSYFNEFHPDFVGMLATLRTGVGSPMQRGKSYHRRCTPWDRPARAALLTSEGMMEFRSSWYAEWVHKQPVWIEAAPQFAARKLPHRMEFMTCFPLALSGDEGYVTDRRSEAYWGMFPKICDALGILPPD